MKIEPRKHLLEIWRATVEVSRPPGSTEWSFGGREGSNSISDAEQLLCIMLPATEIPRFSLDRPDETDADALMALRGLGDATQIPRRLVRVLIQYLKRYALPDGEPTFAGGSYRVADPLGSGDPTDEQLSQDVVEGFASSITLVLSALGFARVFRKSLTRADLIEEIEELERLANRRLSAAMVGLLRSFSIKVFPVESPEGRELLRTVNQAALPERDVIDFLHTKLEAVAAGLRDLNIGIEAVKDLDNKDRLFECGWSWGVTTGAPEVTIPVNIGEQRKGYAADEPFLYFTVVALDAIADLFANRTRVLGLLNEEQSRLSDALRKRWDLTQQYWGTIAEFGTGRWPLEDIPWRTTDGGSSDFFSLLVTSIAARELAEERDTDADLVRVGHLLRELANRGRVNRRPLANDPAVAMHHPGVPFDLFGMQDIGPALSWVAADFAPLLLKRAIRVAQLITDLRLRRELLELADQVWAHVLQRRIGGLRPNRDLWDRPDDVFGVSTSFERPSWHHTVRVVESLILAANLIESHPLRSDTLSTHAEDLLAEAEHLYDQELLAGSAGAGRPMQAVMERVGQRLTRAREVMLDRPGSSAALLTLVLSELDSLAVARQDVQGAA